MRNGVAIRMRRLPRRLTVLALLAVLGCSSGQNRGTADPSTLTILYDADERIFAPYWSVEAQFLMFLPLAAYGERGEIVGRLARRWEHSTDRRIWTFYLRSDVKWHDGVPVTAHDVKFTIELSAHPDILFEDVFHDLESITVTDDTTLTLVYSRPKDMRNTWAVYYPKHLLEDLDPKEFWQWEFWTHPVGNGPYRYVRHVPKTMVELEANPDFFAGKPRIDRMILKFGGQGIPELLSGNVDVLTWVNQADLPKLEGDPRFNISYFIWPDVSWLSTIYWNQRYSAFRDVRVRRALTLAIDRRQLVRALNLPEELRLTDVIFTSRQYWSNELPPLLPYDTVEAARLLTDAGWIDTDGDGVRDNDGSPLRFEVVLNAGSVTERAAILVQAQLRQVGVAMELRPLENRVWRGKLNSSDYDAAFAPLYNAIDGHLRWLGEKARFGYDNPAVAELLASVKETADQDEIDAIYREIMPIIRADLPMTILFPQVQTYAVDRRLRGLESPYRGDPILFMEDLWLDAR